MAVRDLVSIALFAALIVALGLTPAIPVPFMPGVPLTLQSTGFLLTGALLGSKRAFLCSAVFWVLIAVGLPVLPGGRGGIAVFAGPTAGYLVGYGFGAALIGFLFERMHHRLNMVNIVIFLALGGIGVIYGMGILWFYVITEGASLGGLILANMAFLPGAAVKIAVCCVIIKIVNKSFPDFAPYRK